jgi:hypothetical protein
MCLPYPIGYGAVMSGIPASQLSDEGLERELARLHETRHDTFMNGTEDALETHTRRMLEMEQEYLRRFPDRVQPDPGRVRAERS